MTFKQFHRRIGAKLFPPIVWCLIKLIWKTCTIKTVVGSENLREILDTDEPFIPCYWHQQQLFCIRYLLDSAEKEPRLRLGYLISPSKDGDVATNMFGSQGVHIIRGSATRGGAQALREIYLRIRKDRISPIVTPDGPTGPIFKCKPGVAMLSQLSKAPMLPLAYAAAHTWHLRSWDRFMIPRPFTQIVIGVGEPVHVKKEDSKDDFSSVCHLMDERLNALSESCQKNVV